MLIRWSVHSLYEVFYPALAIGHEEVIPTAELNEGSRYSTDPSALGEWLDQEVERRWPGILAIAVRDPDQVQGKRAEYEPSQ